MNALISAGAGALSGSAVLLLALVWLRNLCLPVSADEAKWQCDVNLWIVGSAYFAASFMAALIAQRRRVSLALVASVLLFLAHALTPLFALIFFGKNWYRSEYTLLFSVVPAVAGAVAALLARRGAQPPAP